MMRAVQKRRCTRLPEPSLGARVQQDRAAIANYLYAITDFGKRPAHLADPVEVEDSVMANAALVVIQAV